MKNNCFLTYLFVCLFVCFLTCVASAATGLSGFSQPQFQREIANFTFKNSLEGWLEENKTQLSRVNESLLVESESSGAALYHVFDTPCSRIRLKLRIKTPNHSKLCVYWLTKEFPRRDVSRMSSINLTADDQFHDYEMSLPASGHLTFLSFQLLGTSVVGNQDDQNNGSDTDNVSVQGGLSGLWFFDSIEVSATVPFPLVVKGAVRSEKGVRYTLKNSGQTPIDFTVSDILGQQRLEAGKEVDFTVPIITSGNLAIVSLKLAVKDFPPVEYPIFIYLPSGKTDWIVRQFDGTDLYLEVSPDAQIARIIRKPDVINRKPDAQ